MMRSEASGLIDLIEMPELAGDLLRLQRVQGLDDLGRGVGARLVLDARVEVLRVLADDDEVDVLVARADARVRLARAQARVQLELVPERDVDRAEAGADRRRDRPLQRDAVLLHRGERLLGERRSRLLHHVDAGLADVPLEVDAGRLEDAARRLGELRPGPVAGNEGDAMGHGRGDRTCTPRGIPLR